MDLSLCSTTFSVCFDNSRFWDFNFEMSASNPGNRTYSLTCYTKKSNMNLCCNLLQRRGVIRWSKMSCFIAINYVSGL